MKKIATSMLKGPTNLNQQEQPHSNNKTNSTERCQPVECKNKQLRYLNICVINCCSMRNRLSYVLDHVKDHTSDIGAITESWLSTEECNNEPFLVNVQIMITNFSMCHALIGEMAV